MVDVFFCFCLIYIYIFLLFYVFVDGLLICCCGFLVGFHLKTCFHLYNVVNRVSKRLYFCV